jgi:hypothetical protein
MGLRGLMGLLGSISPTGRGSAHPTGARIGRRFRVAANELPAQAIDVLIREIQLLVQLTLTQLPKPLLHQTLDHTLQSLHPLLMRR